MRKKKKQKKQKKQSIVISIISTIILLGIILLGSNFNKTEEFNNFIKVNNLIENQTEGNLENLIVYFIDVGQADSILIKNQDDTLLIDAGNNEDGQDVVNFIKGKGITKLNYVIGTHPHEDHIGGLDDVINSDLKIENLWMTKINLSSIVIRLEFENNSFLFMGDAETANEKTRTWMKTDVLKVGHHGSNTSSSEDFLKQINPTYAVIMAGKNNSYGLPKQKILDRLAKIGAKVYRTDEEGTIMMISNGNNIEVKENT